jgi:two-component system chemotaxis response regulator CheB
MLKGDEMAKRDIVVMGTSAGGFEALKRLVPQFPRDFDAAILLVIHTGPGRTNFVADLLNPLTPLTVSLARHDEPVEKGRIYVAPPDQHMLVIDGHIHLTRGPRENWVRPAVDPLFRSAAMSFGPRAIGVVLTGYLDDGAGGLVAIKRCRGLALVQDPADAAYPDMPRNAMRAVDVDYRPELGRMGAVLAELVDEDVNEEFTVPPDLALEVAIDMKAKDRTTPEIMQQWGKLVPLSCPECGGPIWERQEGDLARYRCLVGHAFSAQSLLAEQSEKVESTLWTTVRTLEEHARVLAQLAEDKQQSRELWMAFAERAADTREKAQVLRSLLTHPEPVAKSA